MAAVLSAGEGAVLSGLGAAFLWKVRSRRFPKDLEVTVPGEGRSRDGLRIRRRRLRDHEVTIEQGIPVTTPLATLIDLATVLTDKQLEAAINEADKLDLVPAHEIPALVDAVPRRPGKRRLAELITKHVPKRTDTGLERALLKIIREAKLPLPETQYVLDGDRVDFYWPDIGLVVETDGGRYHRTPLQRAADTRRDQKHFRAGRTPLRFSDDDVDHPAYVERVLADVIARLCD